MNAEQNKLGRQSSMNIRKKQTDKGVMIIVVNLQSQECQQKLIPMFAMHALMTIENEKAISELAMNLGTTKMFGYLDPQSY